MIKQILNFILGNGTVLNKVAGGLNYLAMIPLATWFMSHADETIKFETSMGFLGLMIAVAFFVMEVVRRSRPAI